MSADKREVERGDLYNIQAAIHGAEGIFTALSWISEGQLDDYYEDPADLQKVRDLLIVAGETLCKQAGESF